MTRHPLIKLPERPAAGVTRLAFTADNHLRLTHSGSLARGQDFYRATRSVIYASEARGASVILQGGDFLDQPEVTSTLARQLQLLDVELARAGLDMYVIRGNHDWAEPSWAAVQNASREDEGRCGIKPLDEQEQDVVRIGTPQTGGIQVLGVPFLSPTDLRAYLAEAAQDPLRNKAQVLMWHGQVLEFAKFPSPDIVTIADFAAGPWPVILLGDIHQLSFQDVVRPDGSTMTIGYPGATEMVKRDEPLTHHFVLLDFDQKTKRLLGTEAVPVDHRPVITLRIESTEDLLKEAKLLSERSATSGDRLMVLATYWEEVGAVRSTLAAAAGAGAIVRCEAFTRGHLAAMEGAKKDRETRQPEDYIPQFVHRTDLQSLARQCCNPEADFLGLMRQHVQKANEPVATQL